jgi:hypothetical protein
MPQAIVAQSIQLRCAEAGTSAAEIEAIKRTLKLPGKEHERLES